MHDDRLLPLAPPARDDALLPLAPRIPGVERVAVLRANGLGDFIFAEPALAALKAAYPDAELTLLGAPWHAEELAGRPGPVDRVEVVPPGVGIREPMPPAERGYASADALADWAGALAGEQPFDLAVQLHGGGRNSNPLVRALGARVAVGLATPDAEPLDRTLPYHYFQPEVFRYLEVAAQAGAPPVRIAPRWEVTTSDRLHALDVLGTTASLAVLAPGAGDGRRRWPAASFAHVGDALAAEGLSVALTGAASEGGLVREVRASMHAPSADLSGRLSVGALGAVLERAAVVVANDSGALHLARAVGAPTVGVYWCGNLITAGPLVSARHRPALSWRLACPVCGADCMGEGCSHDASFVADVPVAEVTHSALSLARTASA